MKTALYILCLLLMPGAFFAQGNGVFMRSDAFRVVTVREEIVCSNAWHALRIIERLGSFDQDRFGTDHILRQIVERGCDECAFDLVYRDGYGTAFDTRRVIGPSERSIVESAKALISNRPLQTIPTSRGHSNQQSDALCAPLTVKHPDDLGTLLYHLIAKTPDDRSALYVKYLDMAVFCDHDIWDVNGGDKTGHVAVQK